MPYNKTEVRNKLRAILNQLYTMNEHGEVQVANFSEFTESLENLWTESAKLYQRGQDGRYPALNADNYGKLIAAYGQALEKANTVLGQTDGNQALHDLTENLTGIIHTDVNALENIVPGENVTLPEVVEKGRSITVDLGKVVLAGSGNALSSRIPIQYIDRYGNERKGFFTQQYSVPGRKEANEAMKPVEEKYPQYKTFFDKLKGVEDKTFFAFNWAPLHSMEMFMNHSNKPSEALFDVFFDGLQISPEEKTEICSRPDYYQFMHDLTSAVSSVALANMTYCDSTRWLGGKAGERIDNRNSAMSMVSKLLGLPELIAPAEPMTIIVDGKEIQGTFMENAYGKEVFGLKPDDPIHQYTVENFDNPAVFSQIADMQVVDYICGNIDRHEGNFFMQFDGEGPDAKLNKLTLIDNDLSFGKNVEGTRIGNKFVLPTQMAIIDKDTSVKVMALTKAALSVGLKGYGLSDEQINYAWTRTRVLQNQIFASIKAYENVPEGKLIKEVPRIVSKESMSKYSLKDLSRASTNSQFEVFNSMQKKIRDNTGTAVETKDRIAAFNNKYNIVEAPKKPKAVRLQGELSKNSLFIKPDEELISKPMDTVDVEIPQDAQLGSVGGAMSSRKLISYIDDDGIEQKGFFTSRSALNAKTQTDLIFKETIMQYPEFKDYLEELKKRFDNGEFISKYIRGGLPGYSVSDVNDLMEDPRFNAMVSALPGKLSMAESNIRNYVKGYGASAESFVDMRNVAMSNMAALMGNDTLLANSKPMRMKQGNRIIEGVFMELAHGIDYSNIHEGDPVTEYTEEVYNYGPGLKSIADLQVLDFICMNVDRHQGNMFYQFEEIDGQMKFVGVQGIDNDLSFFTQRAKDNEAIENAGALEDIKVISEAQARFIQNAKPEDVEAALGSTKLTISEISATMDRIYRLKDRINSNKIQVLSDADWDKKTLSELSSGNNTFAMIKKNLLGEQVKNQAKANGPRVENKALQFTAAEKKEFSGELVQQSAELLDEEIKNAFDAHYERELTRAEKIIKDRFELKELLEAEHQRNLQAKNPFDEEGLTQLRNELAELDAAYHKSNHYFGGSEEYTKAVRGYKDLKTLLEAAPQRLRYGKESDVLEFMEDLSFEMQYVKMMASGLEQKTKDSTSSNQLDRKAFAEKLNGFAKNLTERVNSYRFAIREKQDVLIEQKTERRMKPLHNYIEENEYNIRHDHRTAIGYLNMKIGSGLKHLADCVKNNKDCDKEKMGELISGFFLKQSLEEIKATKGDNELGKYDDKIKTMLANMQKNSYVLNLAESAFKEPEAFANIITTGKINGLYKDFKRSLALQKNNETFKPEKQSGSRVVSNSEEPSQEVKVPGF